MTRWFTALTAASVIGLGVFAAAWAEESRTSERMLQACTAMMDMATQMGGGDAMAGMVRMMEMMAGTGGMGDQMDGMMGPGRAPQRPE
jgi:hypothetical protein